MNHYLNLPSSRIQWFYQIHERTKRPRDFPNLAVPYSQSRILLENPRKRCIEFIWEPVRRKGERDDLIGIQNLGYIFVPYI